MCVTQVYEHHDGSKSLKLGDFGLATVVNGPLYTVCGTPTYVAPEIVAETGWVRGVASSEPSAAWVIGHLLWNKVEKITINPIKNCHSNSRQTCYLQMCLISLISSIFLFNDRYGLKVDIWAAGVITYILLCGFPPFRGYVLLFQEVYLDKHDVLTISICLICLNQLNQTVYGMLPHYKLLCRA